VRTLTTDPSVAGLRRNVLFTQGVPTRKMISPRDGSLKNAPKKTGRVEDPLEAACRSRSETNRKRQTPEFLPRSQRTRLPLSTRDEESQLKAWKGPRSNHSPELHRRRWISHLPEMFQGIRCSQIDACNITHAYLPSHILRLQEWLIIRPICGRA